MDNRLELVLLLLFLVSQSAASPAADYYQAVENIAVDCGSTTGDQTINERLWLADRLDSKNFTLYEPSTTNKSTPSAVSHPPGGELEVPYLTARVSHSRFTYSFPVSPGQKFIRLHFYPTNTYSGFETYPAFFSVTVGNFVLLSNFTGEPWNPGSPSVVYIREFLVNLGEDEKKLNVTFTPSSSVVPDAYAFVNGVQVVSMPSNLYYSKEELYSQEYALELIFRINVGGASILPEDDTGMFRNWDSDQGYEDNPVSVGPMFMDNGITLNLTSNAKNYTAPEKVYKTAEAMDPDMANNEQNNISWMFPLDSGFTYLVRLHFCQLFEKYAKPGTQVFDIFVAASLVEEGADLTQWGGGFGVPLYRDYVVKLQNPTGAQETAKMNLSIVLRSQALRGKASAPASLNGVEIFKASSDVGDLAGIRFYTPSIRDSTSGSGLDFAYTSSISKYVITGGVSSGIIVLCPLLVAITIRFGKLKRKKLVRDEGKKNHDSLSSSGSACRCFSLSEIKAATNNFNQEFIIGLGGFGNVYKGFVDKGATAVAIKRLQQGSDQGANEFKMEIEMLSQLRYLHLVSLIGYCDKNKEMILVYDYMSRGSLRDHLYNTVSPPLPWERRLRICIGTARGLQYLHSGVKRMIIHRDIKTTNILLDEKWVAKVSDFGLSKVSPCSSSVTHISTMVKGSFGYLDPEYYYLQRLTQKSDVYSFGVVLCEVLCAKPAIIRSEVDNPVSLAMWFRTSYQRGTLDEIIDPYLIGKIAPECLNKYAELAFHCIAEIGVNRPQMGDVVWGLELALRLQDAATKERVVEMEAIDGSSSREDEESEAETELESEAEAETKL